MLTSTKITTIKLMCLEYTSTGKLEHVPGSLLTIKE